MCAHHPCRPGSAKVLAYMVLPNPRRVCEASPKIRREQDAKLKDRVAVITGSGSGIGRAAAIEFAREGARVIVADINLAGARETVDRIRQIGGESHAVETDGLPPGS